MLLTQCRLQDMRNTDLPQYAYVTGAVTELTRRLILSRTVVPALLKARVATATRIHLGSDHKRANTLQVLLTTIHRTAKLPYDNNTSG